LEKSIVRSVIIWQLLNPSSALRVAAAMSSTFAAVATPIEHIVLIKVRPESAASGAATAMFSAL
jgi:peroxin-10